MYITLIDNNGNHVFTGDELSSKAISLLDDGFKTVDSPPPTTEHVFKDGKWIENTEAELLLKKLDEKRRALYDQNGLTMQRFFHAMIDAEQGDRTNLEAYLEERDQLRSAESFPSK